MPALKRFLPPHFLDFYVKSFSTLAELEEIYARPPAPPPTAFEVTNLYRFFYQLGRGKIFFFTVFQVAQSDLHDSLFAPFDDMQEAIRAEAEQSQVRLSLS